MLRRQGGFKEVIKKSFPEADLSLWSMPISHHSFFPPSRKYILIEYSFLLQVDTKQDIHNCREAFLHFAKEKGFDPLQPENWYNITDLRKLEVRFFPV